MNPATVPIVWRGVPLDLAALDVLSLMDFTSKAYNLGYALGFTEKQIDALPASELQRFFVVAQETLAGNRSTPEHVRLALRPRLLKWVLGKEQ
jgi:TolB-like protein